MAVKFDHRATFGDDISKVEHRLRLLFTNRPALNELIRRGLTFGRKLPSEELDGRLNLFDKMELVSERLLEAILSGGESYRTASPPFIWKNLVKSEIVFQIYGEGYPVFATHRINKSLLERHLLDDTFQNLFYDARDLIGRYARSILTVDVKTRRGDLARGTCFIARVGSADYVITCRHNIDPADGIHDPKVADSTGVRLDVGDFRISNSTDVAVCPISGVVDYPVFRFSGGYSVFDNVYTLGYPNIAGAYPILLGHRGEVNGTTETYLEKSPVIIVSNLVAPGISGGPVLTQDGRCIGMTFRWLEHSEGLQLGRFSAALPANAIEAYVQEAFGHRR
jgi:hypothetical protein